MGFDAAVTHPDTHSPAPTVAVHLDPALLADLLRRRLAARGVAVADPAVPSGRVAAALVGADSDVRVDADFVVRLAKCGAMLPAQVEVEAAQSGADTPRFVMVGTVDDLVDVLVALTE